MRVQNPVLWPLLLGLACDRPAGPSTDSPPAVSASAAAPAATVASPAAPSAASPTKGTDTPADAAPAELDAGRAAAVGGTWLRCYAGFTPRSEPTLDVMRLGLMCGPVNGMKKVTDAQEASLPDGGSGREHRWQARAGDCYRIFAVAEPSVEDLDVQVFDPRGRRIAFDTSDDRWPVVQPDRPFCVMEPGDYRAQVHAQRGAGRYAIEIWRLR